MVNKMRKKPRDYKNKEEFIAFRAEDGNIDNLKKVRNDYGYSSISELLRMMVTRFIQLNEEKIFICDREVCNKVITLYKEKN